MENEFRKGTEGWCWMKGQEPNPCIFVKNNKGKATCLRDGLSIVGNYDFFSIEKPERFNVGDVVDVDGAEFTFIKLSHKRSGNKSSYAWWRHDEKYIAHGIINDTDTLLYTAEQLDDPANYKVHKSKPQIDGLELVEIYEEDACEDQLYLVVKMPNGLIERLEGLPSIPNFAGFVYEYDLNKIQPLSRMWKDHGCYFETWSKSSIITLPKYVAFVKEGE